MKTFRITIILLFILSPVLAVAQVVPDPVQYVIYPEIPGPNQSVNLEVQGVGSFLGDAMITWVKDGTVVQKGYGLTQYTFVTGPLGKPTDIRVTSQSSTQGTFNKEFIFNPSLVNMVWEADTTVPPLYKGKALYSAGSPLKVVAFPVVYSGASRIAASSLSYQWTHGTDLVPASSGLGRNTFSFTGNQLDNQEDVSVDVYYGTAQVAHGSITIPATTPALVLYQRDPLRGVIYDTAFPSSITLLDQEITVQAEPFYFARADQAAGALTYAWQLNGSDATGPDSAKGILTLRQAGSGQGQAQVGVSLQDYNSDTFVQNASAALQLVFGTQPGTLFGL